jgi:hypothetical protein
MPNEAGLFAAPPGKECGEQTFTPSFPDVLRLAEFWSRIGTFILSTDFMSDIGHSPSQQIVLDKEPA